MEEGSKPDNSTPVAEEQEELEEDYEDYEYDENGKVIYVYGADGGKEPKLSPLGNCKKNLCMPLRIGPYHPVGMSTKMYLVYR